MKKNCERCGGHLDTNSEAYICTYECTFCPRCTDEMQQTCPNCRGELVLRPRRSPPDENAG
ncbi:MAG: DUF1272 domain-containing protein [Phycisphaerales bacterium]|nr:DUF1272 domain-containing protein [Phycisphaerales bacterium]